MPSTLTTAPAPSAASTAATARSWPLWLILAAFSVLWFDFFHQLSYVWAANEQYAYGWFVPFFALGLFWSRWRTRPRPEPPTSFPLFLKLAAVLLGIIYFPIRVIHEINQDWPTFNWCLALPVVGLSMIAVGLAGGRAWARHFGFPICFTLVAVRWPSMIEVPLTQGLMKVAARVTVEILGWLNIPALEHGNLIEVAAGTVGVDEACSGIRSFQATLMAALLLGEFYMLTWPRRLLLLAVGLPMAFVFNIVRTTFLAAQASASGLEAIDRWHDRAGISIFLVCFASLWLLSVLLSRSPSKNTEANTSNHHRSSTEAAVSTHSLSVPAGISPLLQIYLAVIACWAILAFAFTQFWYRPKNDEKQLVHWNISMPQNQPSFQELEIPRRTWQLLACDSGAYSRWQEDNAAQWNVYFFRWDGKSQQSLMGARGHEPEVCIGGKGMKLVSHVTVAYLDAAGLKLPFRRYTFAGQDQLIHVFFCLWQDGDELRNGMRWSSRKDRLIMAREGRRTSGQQTLEIITKGYSTLDEAERAVRRRLPQLVKLETP